MPVLIKLGLSMLALMKMTKLVFCIKTCIGYANTINKIRLIYAGINKTD